MLLGHFKKKANVNGFTLIELLVTLAILAILAAFAWPNFQNVIVSNRITTTTNEFIATVASARMEAMKNKSGAGVCASADGTACDGTWADGWIVWQDSNSNSEFDGDERVLSVSKPNAELMMRNGEDTGVEEMAFAFDPKGRIRDNLQREIVIQPKKCSRGGSYSKKLTVAPIGQVRKENTECEDL